MPLHPIKKAEVVKEYQQHEKDTGSPEVQIALLTEDVRNLTEHLKANKKDYATQRGLLMLVGRRRRLLGYLRREDLGRYQNLIASLGLRR